MIRTSNAGDVSGELLFSTGTSSAGSSGGINIETGATTGGESGSIKMKIGTATTPGKVFITMSILGSILVAQR